jgi:hypothetical protein
MMKRKKNLTPDERRALREALAGMRADLRELRLIFEDANQRHVHARRVQARRRARLRRLTFGLLGR